MVVITFFVAEHLKKVTVAVVAFFEATLPKKEKVTMINLLPSFFLL